MSNLIVNPGQSAMVDWEAVCGVVAKKVGDCSSIHDVLILAPVDDLDDEDRVRQARDVERETREAENIARNHPELARHLSVWQLYALWDDYSSDDAYVSWADTDERDTSFLAYLLGLALCGNQQAETFSGLSKRHIEHSSLGFAALKAAGVTL
ncbi:hypothetical protein ACG04R_16400 [Roseateles sp. BYS78W]|uniref:Uncharacterized protein n=1 Tax=Pelomonas candidula TaxID=3299025 RepID=A0ABW7HEB2_9BURK